MPSFRERLVCGNTCVATYESNQTPQLGRYLQKQRPYLLIPIDGYMSSETLDGV